MMLDDEYHGDERRKTTWTLWREIYGTFIGMLPFIVGLIVFGATLWSDVNVMKAEQRHMKDQQDTDRAATRYERDDIARKLERISTQIESLQQQVARQSVTAPRDGR